MIENEKTRNQNMAGESGKDKPAYVPPTIVTYTSEEILEQIGPAMACSPSPILRLPEW
jgi:hypothetical protein